MALRQPVENLQLDPRFPRRPDYETWFEYIPQIAEFDLPGSRLEAARELGLRLEEAVNEVDQQAKMISGRHSLALIFGAGFYLGID